MILSVENLGSFIALPIVMLIAIAMTILAILMKKQDKIRSWQLGLWLMLSGLIFFAGLVSLIKVIE